tara:strand:- start:343 stop:948 length:606 start_codon:yes stop_codon:yes gene_type:complete
MGLISNGTTIFDAGAMALGGSMTFIKKLTASSSGTLSFVNGASNVVLDNTYKEYIFTFKDIHPATDEVHLTVGFRDGSTDYDATKTTSYFQAYHNENDSATALSYITSRDLAQSTDFQQIANTIGNDNDQQTSGYLHLFNPSSTTFVKHFYSRFNIYNASEYSVDNNVAGYCNVTAAIDAVQFKMSSGNIDAGDICLYGIS